MAYAAYIAETRRERAIRWACAAALIIGLHAGGALALYHFQQDDSPDIPGFIAIELAPVVTAPPVASAEVAPPGPLMEEEAPAQEARKETKETVAEEMPRLEQAPLAAEPAIVLPVPKPEKKDVPEEEKMEKVVAERNSRDASAVPKTTAPPPVEANPTETAVAPSPGLSTRAARAQASWHNSLVAHINRYKRYPADARAHSMEGAVTVEFTLDPSGQVLSSRIVDSSGSTVLDEEAMALLKRAAPLPAPPAHLSPDGLYLTLPIEFTMK
jgi:protein TonB